MSKRPAPRTLTVLSSQRLSPSMIRVTLGGEAIRDFPPGFAGGYVKLMLAPASAHGKAVIRTYTIRHQHAEAIDLDFALHGGAAAGHRGFMRDRAGSCPSDPGHGQDLSGQRR